MRLAVIALAALVSCVQTSGSSARPGESHPKPIVIVDHLLVGFAQDGGRVAWATRPCGQITIRDLATRREFRNNVPADCALGDENVPGGFGVLALGGTRAIWWTWWHGNLYYQDLYTWTVGGRTTDLGETISTCDDNLIADLTADGDRAFYAELRLDGQDPDNDPCGAPWIKGGGVRFLNRAGYVKRLAGVPPAVALAVSQSLLAVIPLDPDPQRGGVRPAPNGPVQLYDARTGKLRTSIQPDGTAIAMGLSQDVLAVLVRTSPGHKRIDLFDPRSGATLGSKVVPQSIAPEVSVAGKRVVYRVKRRIYLLDSASGTRSIIGTASGLPIGLSIEGSRIAWAENAAGRGRIFAIQIAAH